MWTNKIINHTMESPSDLCPNGFNHRLHPEKQVDATVSSLEELGVIKSVIVNKTTGNIIDGHLRVEQGLKIEAENPSFQMPVEWVNLTKEEELLALAILDKTCELASVDPNKLDKLLREIQTGSEALANLLTDMAEKSQVLDLEKVEKETKDQINIASDSVWQIMVGEPEVNIDGSLIQMLMPKETMDKILKLIIKEHGEL